MKENEHIQCFYQFFFRNHSKAHFEKQQIPIPTHLMLDRCQTSGNYAPVLCFLKSSKCLPGITSPRHSPVSFQAPACRWLAGNAKKAGSAESQALQPLGSPIQSLEGSLRRSHLAATSTELMPQASLRRSHLAAPSTDSIAAATSKCLRPLATRRRSFLAIPKT